MTCPFFYHVSIKVNVREHSAGAGTANMPRQALEAFIVDFMMGLLSVLMLYGAFRALCANTLPLPVMAENARVIRGPRRRRSVWSRRTVVRRLPLSPVAEEPTAPRRRANSVPATVLHAEAPPVARRHSTGAVRYEFWCDEWVEMPRNETWIHVPDTCLSRDDIHHSHPDTPRPSFEAGRRRWWHARAGPVTQPLLFEATAGGNIYHV